MKISRRFCQQFLAAPLPASDEMAAILTARGLETESVTAAAASRGIVAGKITACAPHPKADKLRLCTVDIAAAAPLQIICGAPNVRPGLLAAVAPPGAAIAASPNTPIAARPIRGIASNGMLCSPAELDIGADHTGIAELTATDAAPGDPLHDILHLQDHLLEINITPNRGDCLSHLGIARELAAALDCATHLPALPPPPPATNATNAKDAFPLAIDPQAARDCPYYAALVIRAADCAAPLPWRLRTLLERCGHRPVSAVVDITNYLMLAYGQPLHAFDLDKLSDGIRVRRAAAGDDLTTLDGTSIACPLGTLLIADHRRPIALAGVMGGADSGITPATRDILIEGAHFTPAAVAGVARAHKLNSDAAHRFERGVDPTLPPRAILQAAAWIQKTCGGGAGPLTHTGAPPPPPPPIALNPNRIEKLLGIAISPTEAATTLNRLQIPTRPTAAGLESTVPTWRFDLGLPEDLIEEIARHRGYADLPETLPQGARAMQATMARPAAAERARDFLAAHGFYEIVTYAFVPPAWEAALSATAPIPLKNPMSEDMSVMRQTLWGGLLDRALHNLRMGREDIFLFEIGRCFLPPPANPADSAPPLLPPQPLRAAGIMLGVLPSSPMGAAAPATLAHAKTMVELLIQLAQSDCHWRPLPPNPHTHPHAAAAAHTHPQGDPTPHPLGIAGELHPSNPLRAPFGKRHPILFELTLPDPPPLPPTQPHSTPPRLSAITRDLSFSTEAGLTAGSLLATARALAPAMVTEVRLFDHYVADAKPRCGLRYTLQSKETTLTGDQIEATMQKITTTLTTHYPGKLHLHH